MIQIRPLTAAEYREILAEHDVSLRVSNGTREETWRFWIDDGQLMYRRQIWTEDKEDDGTLLESVLEGDGTTQLVVAGGGVA